MILLFCSSFGLIDLIIQRFTRLHSARLGSARLHSVWLELRAVDGDGDGGGDGGGGGDECVFGETCQQQYEDVWKTHKGITLPLDKIVDVLPRVCSTVIHILRMCMHTHASKYDCIWYIYISSVGYCAKHVRHELFDHAARSICKTSVNKLDTLAAFSPLCVCVSECACCENYFVRWLKTRGHVLLLELFF